MQVNSHVACIWTAAPFHRLCNANLCGTLVPVYSRMVGPCLGVRGTSASLELTSPSGISSHPYLL